MHPHAPEKYEIARMFESSTISVGSKSHIYKDEKRIPSAMVDTHYRSNLTSHIKGSGLSPPETWFWVRKFFTTQDVIPFVLRLVSGEKRMHRSSISSRPVSFQEYIMASSMYHGFHDRNLSDLVFFLPCLLCFVPSKGAKDSEPCLGVVFHRHRVIHHQCVGLFLNANLFLTLE